MRGETIPSPAKGAYYLLFILALVNLFNALDKMILSMLIEPIKAEFVLNDTQIGLLAGLSLAFFNAVAMVPLGMLADRTNRRNLIAFCLTIWSAATALGGMASSYVQLLLSRIVVGIGEAGGGPPSLSMISDSFPRERRATALSFFYITAPLGGVLALAVGGWIASHYGWRATLLAAGIPGIVLATILFLTVKEPVRGAYESNQAETVQKASFKETLAYIIRCKSLRHLAIGITLISFVLSALNSWSPAYLIRSHGMTLSQIGFLLALVHATGLLGPLIGGALSDRLAKDDQRWWCWIVAIGTSLAGLSIIGFTLSESGYAALAFNGLFTLAISVWYGPSYGTVQSLAPPHMRATITATLYMSGNIIGFGIGTQTIGLLSDYLSPDKGTESLRYALMLLILVAAWSALHFTLAARTLRRDLANNNNG